MLRNPGPTRPRRLPPALASRPAPWPSLPSPGRSPGATAGPCPPAGGRRSRPRRRVAGPPTRCVREQGVPVARLVHAAHSRTGCEDRQVHAVQAVQELVQEPPIHPLHQPEGEEARLPQASRPLIRRPQWGNGRRPVTEPGTPCLLGLLPLWAVLQDVHLVLVRPTAVGARGVCPRAMAQHPCRCLQGPGHEAAQQLLLQVSGGGTQRCAAGRAICPVAQPPKVTGRRHSTWREGYPAPSAASGGGAPVRSATAALVPGRPSTTSPRAGSTPRWRRVECTSHRARPGRAAA